MVLVGPANRSQKAALKRCKIRAKSARNEEAAHEIAQGRKGTVHSKTFHTGGGVGVDWPPLDF